LVGGSIPSSGTIFKTKAFVDVLRSRSRCYYDGSTNDLARRLEQHQRGHTATTAKDVPWELVASWEMDSLESVRLQERIFKKWKNPKRVLAWFNCAGSVADIHG
jgi:predicted GIY-YIG superfamily endonuclease